MKIILFLILSLFSLFAYSGKQTQHDSMAQIIERFANELNLNPSWSITAGGKTKAVCQFKSDLWQAFSENIQEKEITTIDEFKSTIEALSTMALNQKSLKKKKIYKRYDQAINSLKKLPEYKNEGGGAQLEKQSIEELGEQSTEEPTIQPSAQVKKRVTIEVDVEAASKSQTDNGFIDVRTLIGILSEAKKHYKRSSIFSTSTL